MYTEIRYGKDHSEKLFAAIGCTRDEYRAAPVVHNDCYLEPYRIVRQFPHGYFEELTSKYGFSTKVRRVAGTFDEFLVWWQGLRASEKDPETGR